jgi:hypothetical protein
MTKEFAEELDKIISGVSDNEMTYTLENCMFDCNAWKTIRK